MGIAGDMTEEEKKTMADRKAKTQAIMAALGQEELDKIAADVIGDSEKKKKKKSQQLLHNFTETCNQDLWCRIPIRCQASDSLSWIICFSRYKFCCKGTFNNFLCEN